MYWHISNAYDLICFYTHKNWASSNLCHKKETKNYYEISFCINISKSGIFILRLLPRPPLFDEFLFVEVFDFVLEGLADYSAAFFVDELSGNVGLNGQICRLLLGSQLLLLNRIILITALGVVLLDLIKVTESLRRRVFTMRRKWVGAAYSLHRVIGLANTTLCGLGVRSYCGSRCYLSLGLLDWRR